MKILFLITLLVNITFFFWQFNSDGFNSLPDKSSIEAKENRQILLLKELSRNEQEKNSTDDDLRTTP